MKLFFAAATALVVFGSTAIGVTAAPVPHKTVVFSVPSAAYCPTINYVINGQTYLTQTFSAPNTCTRVYYR